MKLQELAQKLGCRLEGDPSIEITGVAGIDHARAGEATFLANRRYSPPQQWAPPSPASSTNKSLLGLFPSAPGSARNREHQPVISSISHSGTSGSFRRVHIDENRITQDLACKPPLSVDLLSDKI